jgi:3'-phosphoadenosine 5'-phosphosulfate sulfotransferase (PAPS reductase)/FAD synthetase
VSRPTLIARKYGHIERHHATSADLRAYVAKLSGGRVNVAFSMGKDAIAAFLALRDVPGLELSAHYSYLIPGLEFVDAWIAYYERKLGITIQQVPHYSFFRYLEFDVFQTPASSARLRPFRFRHYTNAHMHDFAREVCGVPVGTYVATGVRACDSPVRRTTFKVNGSLNPWMRTFCPIFDWTIADVCEAIQRSGLVLPVDYLLFGRSFDGIDFRFLSKVRERFPRDYARILEWVPMADLEMKRRTLGKVAGA